MIKKEIRENYAAKTLRLATKMLNVRRQNISRVVFYPSIKLAYNRIGKSENSSVVLYLSDAIQGEKTMHKATERAKKMQLSSALTSSNCPRTGAKF